MSMQWITLRQAQEDNGGTVVVQQHWYLTEDKTRVVPEGDTDGRWLWASPGTAVPLADAIRYGAVKVEPEPEKSTVEQLTEDGFDPAKVADAVEQNPITPDVQQEEPVEPVGESGPETVTVTEDAEVVQLEAATEPVAEEGEQVAEKPKARKQSANKARTKAEDK